jgi:hypothetical protein
VQAQQHQAVLWEARSCLEALCCSGKAAGRVALLAALQHSPRFQLSADAGDGTPGWCIRCIVTVFILRFQQHGACRPLRSTHWIIHPLQLFRQLPRSWAAACGGLAVATETDYCRAAHQEAAAAARASEPPEQHEGGLVTNPDAPRPADVLPQRADSGCTRSATAESRHESGTAQVKWAARRNQAVGCNDVASWLSVDPCMLRRVLQSLHMQPLQLQQQRLLGSGPTRLAAHDGQNAGGPAPSSSRHPSGCAGICIQKGVLYGLATVRTPCKWNNAAATWTFNFLCQARIVQLCRSSDSALADLDELTCIINAVSAATLSTASRS